MRLMFRIVPLLFLLAVPAFATPPDAPTPAAPAIRLPELVDVPRPPSPAITKLSSAELYVVDSDVELRVIASPEGIVAITEETGPMKVRAVFAGNLKPSTRTIKGPFIYSVEAVDTETPQTRRVELLITRTDPKVKTIIRRTLDVTSGAVPVPPLPPGPNPPGPNPPGPTPPIPPVPVPVTSFRVIFVIESGDTLTAAQNSVIYGKTVEDFLNATCTGGKAGWRRRDKDLGGENDPTMAALWTAVKAKLTTTPAVAVAVNNSVEIIPLAATPAEMVATLTKYAKGQ